MENIIYLEQVQLKVLVYIRNTQYFMYFEENSLKNILGKATQKAIWRHAVAKNFWFNNFKDILSCA